MDIELCRQGGKRPVVTFVARADLANTELSRRNSERKGLRHDE
jgi:hypothetical protein